VDRVDWLRDRSVRIDRQWQSKTRPHGFAPPKSAASARTIPAAATVLAELGRHPGFVLSLNGDGLDVVDHNQFGKAWRATTAAAGGIVATNYVYAKAPKDGTAIGVFNNNTPFEPLFGTKQATYDPTQFNWLGTPSIETGNLTVWHQTPVTTWEDVKDGKDVIGELHAWRVGWPLAARLPFPLGVSPLYYDPRRHVLAVLTGMATARATASIMALGTDRRFDLSHAYWIVAGTAGVDPKTASAGSADTTPSTAVAPRAVAVRSVRSVSRVGHSVDGRDTAGR